MKRMDSPSLFGGDIQDLTLHAEMQTNNRLHFKVIASRLFLSLSVSRHWNAKQTEVYIAMCENDQEIGHRLIACSFCLRSMISKARDSRSLMSTSLQSQTAPPALSATHSRSETTPLAWLCAERRTRKSCECCHEGLLQLVLGGKIKSYMLWKDK